MKPYAVVFEESAPADVRRSYDWALLGQESQRWVRELRTAVTKQLNLFPRRFPLAPESEEFSEEIRQMMGGRYRVLFTIKKRTVHVLHVKGVHVRGSD